MRLHIGGSYSIHPQIVVMAEALRIGKKHPLREHMQILNDVNLCPFQHGKASVYSFCRQVSILSL